MFYGIQWITLHEVHEGQHFNIFQESPQQLSKGYVFAVVIFHLHILHGFEVLTPGQRSKISFSSGSA